MLSISAALVAGGCGEAPPAAPSGTVSPDPATLADLAAKLEVQAREMLAADRPSDAARAAQEAGHMYQQLRGPRHADTVRVAKLLAQIEVHRGDHAAAEKALLFALAAREAEAGPSSLPVAETLDLLADVMHERVPDREAAYLGRALAIRRAALGPDHPEVARTLTAFGAALLASCRITDAEAALRDALAIRERTAGPTSAASIDVLERLAEARARAGDDGGAEQIRARAAAPAATLLGPFTATEVQSIVRLLGAVAASARDRKDWATARAHGERAVSLAERHFWSTSPALVDAADGLAATHRASGDGAAASALFQRLSLVERVLPPGAVVPPLTAEPLSPSCTPPRSAGPAGGSGVPATAIVAGLAPSFRRCYNAALRQDPHMRGSLRMSARIGAAGEVLGVRTLTPASHAELMVKCPMEALLAAKFAPPEGGSATIVVPVTFVSR